MKSEAPPPIVGSGAVVGHYRVIRLLASGGMGQVYLARDNRLGRLVALKFAHTSLQEAPLAREQFFFEAKATAQLQHPNVVSIFDVGDHEGLPWAAYEFIDGQVLSRRLREGPLPLDTAIDIGIAVISALRSAHDAGLLHRDLKPANVMLGRDGRTRVLDFGIARFSDPKVQSPVAGDLDFVGTPTYMAPEQWRREDSPATDIWAFGLLLCEILTGSHPLKGLTLEAIAQLIADQPRLTFPRSETIPEALFELIDACLHWEAPQRPTAVEVAERLQSLRRARALDADGDDPFPGLTPFEERHSALFFGRREASAELLHLIQERSPVVVVGPAGVGKTSLVEAGLLPELRRTRRVAVVRVLHHESPLEELARSIEAARQDSGSSGSGETRRIHSRQSKSLADQLRSHPESLSVELENLATEFDVEFIVLWVDSVERLFGSTSQNDRQNFFDAISSATVGADGPVRVLLSVRDEYLGRIPFRGGGFRGVLRLEGPSDDALREALEEPLLNVGYRFDSPDLPANIIRELSGLPHAFLLLQFAMRELWERRDVVRRQILTQSYESIGTVRGALVRHADAVIDGLDVAERIIAREIFVNTIGDAGGVTLENARVAQPTDERGQRVLTKLLSARLLEREGERLRLLHPSLPTLWIRLQRWIDEAYVDARRLRELQTAAERWSARGARADEVWRGDALRDAEDLLSRRSDANSAALSFVATGRAVEKTVRRKQRFARVALVIAALLAIIASAAAAWSWREKERESSAARERAEADRLQLLVDGAVTRLASGQRLEARALLREAFEQGDSAQARAALDRLLRDPVQWSIPWEGAAYEVLHDAREQSLWVATQQGDLAKVSVATAAIERRPGPTDQLLAIALSGDSVYGGGWDGSLWRWPRGPGPGVAIGNVGSGIARLRAVSESTLAASLMDGRVVLVDSRSGQTIRQLENAQQFAMGLDVSQDGSRIVVGQRDGNVLLFSADGARLAQTRLASRITSIVFVSQDQIIAGGVNGALTELRISNGSLAVTNERNVAEAQIRSIAIAPNGVLLTVAYDGTLTALQTDSFRSRSSQREAEPVPAIASAGPFLAIARHGSLELLRWRRAFEQTEVDFENSAAVGVAFGSDDSVVTAMTRGDVVLRNSGGRLLRRFSVNSGVPPHSALSFSNDNRNVILASIVDGGLILDRESGARKGLLATPGGIEDFVLSPDTSLAYLWTRNSRIVAGSLETGRIVGELEPVQRRAGFVATETHLYYMAEGGELRRWSPNDGREEVVGTFTGETGQHMARSATGEIAILFASGNVAILNSDGQVVHRIRGPEERAYHVTFNPSGTAIATSTQSGLVRMWTLPDLTATSFRAHEGECNVVAFNAQGNLIATGGDDGTTRVFDVASQRRIWGGEDRGCHLEESGLVINGQRIALSPSPARNARVLRVGNDCLLMEPNARRISLDGTSIALGPVDSAAVVGGDWIGTGNDHFIVNGQSSRCASSGRITAAAKSGNDYLIGYQDGQIARWSPQSCEVGHVLPAVNGRPSSIVQVEEDLMAVGTADGNACLWAPGQRQALRCSRRQGEVIAWRREQNNLEAVFALGETATFDLHVYRSSRCDLNQLVVAELPVRWSGQSVTVAPGRLNGCREDSRRPAGP